MITNLVLVTLGSLLVIHFLYFLPPLGLLFFIIFIAFIVAAYACYPLFFDQNTNQKAVKIIVAIVVIFYLTYCYVVIRDASFDGITTYLKAMYMVKSNPAVVSLLSNPIRPFLIEAVLGFIWRYTSLNIVGLAMGIAAVLVVYLTYYFYKVSGKSTRTIVVSLFLLLGSPVFINLALLEYKIDLFLTLFALLTFIFFYKVITKYRDRYLLLFGLSAGTAVLVKFTFLPIALVLSACVLLEMLVFVKKDIGRVVVSGVVLLFLAIGPIGIWTKLFGARLSYLGYVSRNFQFYQIPKTILSVDKNVFIECRNDITNGDYNQYLPNKSIYDKLAQPINYILNDTFIMPNYFSIFDPGIFLYLATLAYIPIGLFTVKKMTRVQRYLFLTTALYILFFYSIMGPVFWYLLPLFPLIAPTIPEALATLENKKRYKIAIVVLLAAAATNISIYMGSSYTRFAYYKKFVSGVDPATLVYRKMNLWDYAKFIDSSTKGGLMYNLSEFGFDTFSNSSDKILVSTHFFAGTRNFADLYSELREKNVRYINTNIIEVGDYIYTGCALHELNRFRDFSNQYLTPAYTLPNGTVATWQLKNL